MPIRFISLNTATRTAVHVAAALFPLATWGCRDATSAPELSAGTASQLFTMLTVSPNGINLALSPAEDDTVRLRMTAVSAAGTSMDLTGAQARFVSLDTARVAVDSSGLVTGRTLADAYDPARVVASLTINGVTLSDTAFVRVVDVAPSDRLGSLSVQPPSSDDAVWPLGSFTAMVAATTLATDATPYSDPNLLIAFRSSDFRIAAFDQSNAVTAVPQAAVVTANAPGTIWMTGSTYAFGVSLVDSAQYRVDSLAEVRIIQVRQRTTGSGTETYFFPDSVSILPGQFLVWTTLTRPVNSDSVAVIFDDPSAAQPITAFPFVFFVPFGSGNIGPMAPNQQFGGGRSFPTPGIYTYSDGHSATGKIVVQGTTP